MISLRCPHDGKYFFDLDNTQAFAGRIVIKCRGRCGTYWQIIGVAGRPVVEQATEPTGQK